MEFTALLLVGILLVVTFVYQRYKKIDNLPPGPWNLPIFGYLPWLNPKEPYVSLTKLSQKFGPIYGFYLGSIYTVVISDVKLLKQIFFKDAASGRPPLHLTKITIDGKGIIFAQGDLWKDQRKLVHNFLRTLGASKVSQNRNKMEANIMKSVLDLIEHIGSKGGQVVPKLTEILVHNVGSIISRITLGKSWSRDDPTWRTLLGLLDEGSRLMGVAAPLNFLPFLRNYREIIAEGKWSSDDKSVSNLIQAFITEKAKRQGITENFYSEKQFHFLLSDIFGAGLETTVNSILWYILYMAVHQEIQNKVRQELAEVLRGNLPTTDDLPMLPYTEATLAETLRIRSIAPLGIPHAAMEDLKVEKFTIPKGAMILPLMWAIHMNPKIWDDPESFKPERFISKEGKFHKPESFIPFQIGKRMCVGEELAKMSLFLFGATILQKFKVECDDRAKIDLTGICGLTLTPK
ncbi:p450 domain containing protein, partial [Asbolus verrucosus]